MAVSSWRGVSSLTTYSCSSGPSDPVSGAEPRALYAALKDGAKVSVALRVGGPRLRTLDEPLTKVCGGVRVAGSCTAEAR